LAQAPKRPRHQGNLVEIAELKKNALPENQFSTDKTRRASWGRRLLLTPEATQEAPQHFREAKVAVEAERPERWSEKSNSREEKKAA